MSVREHVLLPKGALIEMQEGGGHVKVTAIDPVTHVEVTTVGAKNATKYELERLAVNKLMWKIEKLQKEKKAASPQQYRKTEAPSGWDMRARPTANPNTKFSRLVGDNLRKPEKRRIIKKDVPSGWDL